MRSPIFGACRPRAPHGSLLVFFFLFFFLYKIAHDRVFGIPCNVITVIQTNSCMYIYFYHHKYEENITIPWPRAFPACYNALRTRSSPTQRRVSASCFLRRLSLILVEVVKAFSCWRLQIQCPKAVEPYNQTAATVAAARGYHCTDSSQMCPAIRPIS